MQLSLKQTRRILYGLIFLSGVSGLMYEVVWHRYLAILLGAQARATVMVLAIFLGGISLGYHCFGTWSKKRSRNLTRAYALVEGGLAIWALVFPFLFRFLFQHAGWFYSNLGLNNILIDLVLSVVMIGFPTFLMGGTLPLLTQAVSRGMADASEVHARIYGFNTLGAAFGCLFAGFVMIPERGLADTTYLAGSFNLIVALSVFLLLRAENGLEDAERTVGTDVRKALFTPRQKTILVVGGLSGFYLITLQTVLIRLVGLSTGASNYTFTVVVSIFILGLGIGSVLVRRINECSAARLFWNQLFIAVALILLYFTADHWSYWVHRTRISLRDIPENFLLYQALLGVLFASLFLVPIGLAGLTLPLCFHLLKDDPDTLGERVGQLYGLNTVGCVGGALVGGYFLLKVFDLDQLFKLCALLSLVSAGFAARLAFPKEKSASVRLVLAGSMAGFVVAGIIWFPRLDRRRFIQPFRHPAPVEASFQGAEAFAKYLAGATELVFWKDDPNTTIGVGASVYQGQEISRSIFTNGKSDGNTRGDQFTTIMLAHLPALLAKRLENVCVIGFGTGTTIGHLSLYPEIKQIDVAEISRALIDHASLFDKYNNDVSTVDRVHFHEMDAFRFLEGTDRTFDIIISEPSNPWVAGIENLYSREFYEIAKNKMSSDGIFVQWIHTYSFNDDLLRTAMKTMGSQFPYVSLFQLTRGDLALVGSLRAIGNDDLRRGAERFQTHVPVRQAMREAGISRFESALALEIMPPRLVRAAGVDGEIHTLESPKLSNGAVRAFFVGSSAKPQMFRKNYKEYYASVDEALLTKYRGGIPPDPALVDELRGTFCESSFSRNSGLCEETLALSKYANPGFVTPASYEDSLPARDLASIGSMQKTPATTRSFTVDDLQDLYAEFDTYKKYFSPIAHFSLEHIHASIARCLNSVKETDELYGECLLQRVVVLQATRPDDAEFSVSAKRYVDWFPKLPVNSPNRGKLEEARGILVKLIGE